MGCMRDPSITSGSNCRAAQMCSNIYESRNELDQLLRIVCKVRATEEEDYDQERVTHQIPLPDDPVQNMKVKQDGTVNSNEESDFVSIHFDDSIEGNH